MFKRIKRIVDRNAAAKASSSQSSSARPSNSAFSLTSPLVRELALRVGQGQPAALVQQVASAAVEESGVQNVSSRSWEHIVKQTLFCFVHGM